MSLLATAACSAAPRHRPAADEHAGLLELRFCRGPRGRSSLRARRQRFPLRITVPLYPDPAAPDMAFVYVQNPTGAVFAGDRLLTSLAVDADARVHLTTQSATKLYRMDGTEARHELRFDLGERAYVEHIPDALIPYAGARYRQRTRVELGPGAVFVTAETIAPGRRAYGERFAFELLDLTVEVRRGGRELCVDRLLLEPSRARPDRGGVLGGSDYLVSLLAIAPDMADAGVLAEAIDASVAEHNGAAGTLPNTAGVLARVLAPDAISADRALRRAWAAARDALLGLPLPERRK